MISYSVHLKISLISSRSDHRFVAAWNGPQKLSGFRCRRSHSYGKVRRFPAVHGARFLPYDDYISAQIHHRAGHTIIFKISSDLICYIPLRYASQVEVRLTVCQPDSVSVDFHLSVIHMLCRFRQFFSIRNNACLLPLLVFSVEIPEFCNVPYSYIKGSP